ncbi:hypothetical protein ACP26L_17705 [Paenibacillus sp. S-38]|uniref:hypothetical protein n=1 Tax=Paenibacillus sp. S-38 TaxID=3416710 RepID=UPI003CFB8A56
MIPWCRVHAAWMANWQDNVVLFEFTSHNQGVIIALWENVETGIDNGYLLL